MKHYRLLIDGPHIVKMIKISRLVVGHVMSMHKDDPARKTLGRDFGHRKRGIVRVRFSGII